MVTPQIFTVLELTIYLKHLIDKDKKLQNIWLKGEISNFKLHSPSGHMYFTLKDESSCIKSVMFRSKACQVPFRPENGMKVIVRGYVSVYERDGQYQLYADEMQPDGLGALHLALEQLKARLAEEGLFDQSKKRKLPLLPHTVGVATSLTGAALRDILKIIYRRFPNMQVLVAPCAVQGQEAPREIVRAIGLLNQVPDVDVIITGRGGGSREELWAFNSEEVVRAIATSRVPVIAAVGHETDITLADLAADLRAPTPSAAAELAVPVKSDLQYGIDTLKNRLYSAAQNKLNQKKRISELLAASPALINPHYRFNQEKQYLDQLNTSLQQNMAGFINNKNAILNLLSEKLDALSPLKVLGRGYSICQNSAGLLLKDASNVEIGEQVFITLAKGQLDCTVKVVKTCRNQ